MNLPNYFLADLPPEATLSPPMIAEACRTLKRNRELYLMRRSTQSLVNVLAEIRFASSPWSLARRKPVFHAKFWRGVWTIFFVNLRVII
jgi:hypothetical protein